MEIQNLKLLKALKNHDDGEIIYVLDEKAFYQYDAEKEDWFPVPQEDNSNFTEYDLNKMVVKGMPSLTPEQLAAKENEIRHYVEITKNTVYMLLFKDISYYTVFIKNIKDCNPIEQEVIECLDYLGEIKDIEVYEDRNMVECWVHEKGAELPMVGYFFAYDGGTILCA